MAQPRIFLVCTVGWGGWVRGTVESGRMGWGNGGLRDGGLGEGGLVFGCIWRIFPET